ncbi:MAG: hypothetical protein ACE37J_10630 [Pikeienuella sp.]|uniref:hypothetical protein n=1 Tax=Pikeienuella sp. TaxID=2831957 RepID=UPI00391AB2B1
MSRPRYFVIFGAMRTGSNLLETSLSRYPGLVGLGELFNPGFIGAPGHRFGWGFDIAARSRAPEAFLDAVIAAHPGRTPGFRLFDGHDARMIARAAADPAAARILLTRDPLEAHLSLLIAEETGQWMLGREEDRKRAKVRFDPAAYAAFAARRAAHYDGLRAAMRAAGAPWLELDYADLTDPAALDGAARHAGATGAAVTRAPAILRQNPGPVSDKVENPEDLPEGAAPSRPPAPAEGGFALMEASRALDLVWCVMPGAGEASVRGLAAEIEAAEGHAPAPPAAPASAAMVERRLRRGGLLFAFARHPAARLSALFAEMRAGRALPEAQAALARRFGEDGPEEDAAFDAFLDLAEEALSAAAPAPAFAPQTALLAAAAEAAPLSHFGRAEEGPGALLARLGRDLPGAEGRFRRRLGRTKRPGPAQAARIFALYRRDFLRLGYPPPRR